MATSVASAPMARARSARGEGARLREDILEAADRLLVGLGDEQKVTMRAVAGEVGVSAPSVYLHFESKAALIQAVCEQLFLRLDAALEEAAAGVHDPEAALRARAQAY